MARSPKTGSAGNGSRQAGWADDPRTASRILYALVAFSILVLLVDPLIHKHGPFEVEHYWGFYGLYGLLAAALMVLLAKALRWLVSRPEDYYGG